MSPNDPHDADETDDDPVGAAPLPDGLLATEVRRLVDDARAHLAAAAATSGAGTAIPDDARMRAVKVAAVTAMRPVTSHQVPFNSELLMVVERLAAAVEALTPIDAVTVDHDRRLQRARAAVATLEVQVDDLEHGQRRAGEDVGALRDTVGALAEEVSGLVREVATLRAREESRQRAAATGPAPSAPAAPEGGRAILRRLAVAVAPEPGTSERWARALASVVADVPGPVLDLASGTGEWLDVWIDLGLEASGVDDDPHTSTLRERGHDVVAADPVTHLEGRARGSLGAVTASALADVAPLRDVVRVADAAREALRPGGVLVLAAVHPADAPPEDRLWADPRRRRVHPDLLLALAADRGYAEVSSVALERTDDGGTRAYALVARTAGAPEPG